MIQYLKNKEDCMYFDRKCKITFIAHGATIYTDENRFSDVENYPPLSEAGVEEIEKICQFLKVRRIKNDKIIASPALRTIQSAKMISKIYKQDFEILEELKTRKYGSLNGMTFSQLEEEHHDMLDKLINHPEIPVPEDSESVTDFILRTSSLIEKIVDENLGNRVIIVTYPDVIKAAICATLKIPHSSLPHIYIKTGSATQISYYEGWESLVYSDYTPL